MLFLETVRPDTLDLLRKLQSLDSFKDLRLVGGTALSLQMGHRRSIDLDFFGTVNIPFEEMKLRISEFADVRSVSSSKMMYFLIVDGVKVDIVNYPYAWIDQPVEEDGLFLAGIKDIAAMKLSAITNRGTKKDFVDYYFLLQEYSLQELVEFYKKKYQDASLFTAIKSLTYFDDAENDPMPFMLKSVDWDTIKMSIGNKVGEYLK